MIAPNETETASQTFPQRLSQAVNQVDADALEASEVLGRLTEPETLAMLNELVDKLPMILFMLNSLNDFLGRGETVIDNVAGLVGELKHGTGGIDPQQFIQFMEMLPKVKKATEQLMASEHVFENFPTVINAGKSMVDSGMLDAKVVGTLGHFGRVGAETFESVASKPVPKVGGIFSLLKAMRDPDVQASMSFGLAFAKEFAQHLKPVEVKDA
ncbi:MAG: DUF1641 domain-containing protein [Planctomycetota bacterium]